MHGRRLNGLRLQDLATAAPSPSLPSKPVCFTPLRGAIATRTQAGAILCDSCPHDRVALGGSSYYSSPAFNSSRLSGLAWASHDTDHPRQTKVQIRSSWTHPRSLSALSLELGPRPSISGEPTEKLQRSTRFINLAYDSATRSRRNLVMHRPAAGRSITVGVLIDWVSALTPCGGGNLRRPQALQQPYEMPTPTYARSDTKCVCTTLQSSSYVV